MISGQCLLTAVESASTIYSAINSTYFLHWAGLEVCANTTSSTVSVLHDMYTHTQLSLVTGYND